MLIGPHSTAAEREAFRAKILADPRNFIAQPTLSLSRAPCFIDDGIEPRHVDLRPYVLYGDRVHGRPGRPDARRAPQGLARGQLVAGRRQQRHLGARGVAGMLLSRVADSLYWIGRYLERAEHTARVIDVRLDLGLDRTSNAGGWDFGRLYTMVRQEASPSVRESDRPRRCPRLRRREPGCGPRERHLGARERRAGARRNQLRHVGAAERAVPAAERGARRGRLVGAAALHLPPRHRRRPSLRRRDRRDDGTRRRLAVPAARPVSRARERDGRARRSALPPRVAAAAGPRRVGGPAAIVLGARSVLPLLHRRPAARADCRIPAAQLRVSAVGPLRGGAGRVGAARDRAA